VHKLIAVLFALCLGLQVQAASLNDYSILLPLPHRDQLKLVLGPQSQGSRGALLPTRLSEGLPALVPGFGDKDEIVAERVRVVAVRLDPCFFEGVGPIKCQAQIRMVWQPLLLDRRVPMTQDAALHTFYNLTDAEFAQLLLDLKPYSVGQKLDPLQVHPGFLRHGYDSPYARGFFSVLLRYAGESNFSRVTFMAVNPRGTVWAFGAFDIKQGELDRQMIPRIDFGGQGFFVSLQNLQEFRSQMNPYPPDEADFLSFLDNSAEVKKMKGDADLQKVIRRAYEFENPEKHNPGTLDCVSCHIAQPVRRWAELQFPQWNVDQVFAGSKFSRPLLINNEPSPLFRIDQLRAFGYFGSEPVITDRVLNETAVVFSSLQGR